MKKTAMQELIDGLDLTKIANRDKLVMVKYIIAQCLELEKEQIIDAFVECWKANMPDGYECKLSAKEYYNQTYNKNK